MSNRQNLKSILESERRLLRHYNDFLFPGLPHDLSAPLPGAKLKLGLLRYNGRGEINFFRPLLNGLPQDRYEIHMLVFDADGVDELRTLYPALQYHVLGTQLDAVVKTARAIGLDILINSSSLSGDFLNPVAALLNYRLAPVQISYIADIATAGMAEMDYFLIGKKIGAEDLQAELVETVLTAPGVGFFIPPPVLMPQDRETKRRALGIDLGDVLFVSNAHMLKLTPDLLTVWMDILVRAPGTKLLLMPFSSDLVTGRFARGFLAMLWGLCASHDVARDRIILSQARGRAGTLADLQAGDIFLDSFPYSGATSGAEVLTACLPIVTRSGATMRARYLAAMLDEIGLGDIVAADVGDYSDLAVRLAKTPKLRQEIAGRIGRAVATASFFDAGIIAGQLDIILSGLMKEKTRDLEENVV